jgi:hypothetical protein
MVKVERSFPAPASLAIESRKPNGVYNSPDVMQQLNRDFHNKCYICEWKPLPDAVPEHMLPHENGRYQDRKFDWNNLFLCCHHCNNMKNRAVYAEGILDCCRVDPERFLTFRLVSGEVQVGLVDDSRIPDIVTHNTVCLLNEVYNKRNTGIREIGCDTRVKELTKEMNVLYGTLLKYRQNRNNRLCRRKLQSLLSRSSPFAAFKRNYIRDHSSSYPELVELANR